MNNPRRTIAPATAECIWFASTLDGHDLRIGLPGTARHAADAAIALHRAQALLGALAQWMGAKPDWTWARAAVVKADVTTGERAQADGLLWLDLPAALANRFAAPPPALADRLQWVNCKADLIVGEMNLTAVESQRLEPDALVIIAQSFGSAWPATLRRHDNYQTPADRGHGLAATMLSPDQTRRSIGFAPETCRSSPEGTLPFEVRLGFKGAMSSRCLAPWYEGELPAPASQVSLWQLAPCPQQVATGDLLPWGDGWGMIIRQMLT